MHEIAAELAVIEQKGEIETAPESAVMEPIVEIESAPEVATLESTPWTEPAPEIETVEPTAIIPMEPASALTIMAAEIEPNLLLEQPKVEPVIAEPLAPPTPEPESLPVFTETQAPEITFAMPPVTEPEKPTIFAQALAAPILASAVAAPMSSEVPASRDTPNRLRVLIATPADVQTERRLLTDLVRELDGRRRARFGLELALVTPGSEADLSSNSSSSMSTSHWLASVANAQSLVD